jgi:hypothetical protein
MSLKLVYYGQNDSVNCVPDVTLTGDPGTDQATLTAAGYLGGKIMAVGAPGDRGNDAYGEASNTESIIYPCDSESKAPFATLLNGPGEFSGAIGPAGSKKAPVVRALWQGNVNNEAYDTGATWTGSLGAFLFCGGTTNSIIGKYTLVARLNTNTLTTAIEAGKFPVGICTHIPSTSEPWLGVASLL